MNSSTPNFDAGNLTDPVLHAYIAGTLPEDLREELDALLKRSPEARQRLESARADYVEIRNALDRAQGGVRVDLPSDETLALYLDDSLSPEDRAKVEAILAHSREAQTRLLVLHTAVQTALEDAECKTEADSVLSAVNPASSDSSSKVYVLPTPSSTACPISSGDKDDRVGVVLLALGLFLAAVAMTGMLPAAATVQFACAVGLVTTGAALRTVAGISRGRQTTGRKLTGRVAGLAALVLTGAAVTSSSRSGILFTGAATCYVVWLFAWIESKALLALQRVRLEADKSHRENAEGERRREGRRR